jgi:hypothetical protein
MYAIHDMTTPAKNPPPFKLCTQTITHTYFYHEKSRMSWVGHVVRKEIVGQPKKGRNNMGDLDAD